LGKIVNKVFVNRTDSIPGLRSGDALEMINQSYIPIMLIPGRITIIESFYLF